MSEVRLWGWLSPDHPDPLAGAPLAQAMIAEAFSLGSIVATPPFALDLDSVPPSRLARSQSKALEKSFGGAKPSLDPATRAAASLGQSYRDQLVRRSGKCPVAVDAVVFPSSHDEAQALIDCAAENGFRVLPVGGATSVVGGLDPPTDSRPLVAANLYRMNETISISAIDRKVTVEAGIRLPELEARLSKENLTLGHFPQSFDGASLGGSIAAHGAGQRSDGYGRIAERLLQARLATPRGEWRTEAARHSAAGPWMGGLVPGSEGLFGLITEATMALSASPERVTDAGWLFPSFAAAADAARTIAQTHVGASMVRISDEAETGFLSRFRLARAGLERPVWAERIVLAMKRAPVRPALMIAGFEGSNTHAADVMLELSRISRRHGGISLGQKPGASWRKSRFEAPHLREALMSRGLGVDTFETVAPWSAIASVRSRVSQALGNAIAATSEKAHRGIVMCHLSHSYSDAACLYFTAVFPRSSDPLGQWHTIKHAATLAMLEAGASVTHHHGLGSDHAAFAGREKGRIGIQLLKTLAHEMDPQQIMATGLQHAFV